MKKTVITNLESEQCPGCKVQVLAEDICCYCGRCMGSGLDKSHIECCACPEWRDHLTPLQKLKAKKEALMAGTTRRHPKATRKINEKRGWFH